MQESLNFLKLNNPFSAAIDINISNIPPKWSNSETMLEMRKMLKEMLNNGQAIVRLIKSITLKLTGLIELLLMIIKKVL